MAAFDYVNANAVAVKLITKFGQAGQVIKEGNASGWDSSGNVIPTQPDITIDGIVTPLLQYKKHEIDGEHILATDSYVFFSSNVAPEIDMMITINSQKFRIQNLVILTSVDDINVYRRLQLRR
tara:strand:+ start:110 stop:478 length:369 start_codon:yes stop_codon:yes gene_type:complete